MLTTLSREIMASTSEVMASGLGGRALLCDNMGINLMVLEVEEFNSEVKNDLGGRLTSEAV